MTTQEKKKFGQEFNRVNRKFAKAHFPKVKKSLDAVVSSLIGTIKRFGIQKAQSNLRTDLFSDKLYNPIQNIYKEVGVYHANQSYKFIRKEIGQKGIGRSEQWSKDIIAYLQKTLLQYAVVKTSETLRNHLLLVLQNALDKELTVDEVIKQLEDSGYTAFQAERIIRTEIGRAANTGIKVAADSFGYEMSKEWISFHDARTRGFKPKQPKDHYHMNGQTVDFGYDFVDPRSKERIDYPMAPGGSAGMVINCRCTFAVVPKRDNNGRLIKR